MPIAFQCPQCAKQFNVQDSLAGKQARCGCGTVILVPHAPSVQPPPPAVDPLMGAPLPSQQPIAAGQPLQPQGQATGQGPWTGAPQWQQQGTAQPARKKSGNGARIAIGIGASVGGVAVLGLVVWLVISMLGGGGGGQVAQADFDRWEKQLETGSNEEKLEAALGVVTALNDVLASIDDLDSAKAAGADLRKLRDFFKNVGQPSTNFVTDPDERRRLTVQYLDPMMKAMQALAEHQNRIRKASPDAYEYIDKL